MAFEKRKSTPSYCLKDIYSPLIKDTDLLASASGKSLNTISRKKGVLTGYAVKDFHTDYRDNLGTLGLSVCIH